MTRQSYIHILPLFKAVTIFTGCTTSHRKIIMSDSGTVQLEIDQLKLCIVGASEETRIRVDFELQSQEKYLMWSTGSAVRSTPEVSAFIERTETHENESDSEPNTTEKKGDMCIFGFNDFRFVRSNYVEFTSTNLASVSNTNIFIRVVSLPSEKDAKIAAAAAAASAAAAPAKGGKGAPTPAAVASPTEVAEKILVQAIFPLSKIFIEKTFAVMCDFNDGSLEIQSSDSSVTLGDSSIALRLSFDNELAEFAYGGAFLRFSDLVVRNAPEGFILRCDDVIDPKAKVPPSETELRAKYLENIIKLATSPEAAATFSLSFSGIEQLIPPMILVASAITFDSETAMTVPPEQNIRQSTHLWTYRFSDTPLVFLHKSQVRRLLALSRAELVLHGEMKKERAADGAPVSASFSLDVSALRSPDIISFPLEVPLMTVTSEEDGQGAVESENGGFLLATLGISRPLSTSVENVGVSASSGDMKVNGRSAVGHSAIADPKRDVLREFRAEVDAVVRQIAIEYVQMFPSTSTATPSLPQPPNSVGMAGGSSNNSVDISMDEGAKRSREYEDRRTTFLYEMSIRGIYHELKERLKPRIQRLVRYELRSGGSLTGKKPLGIENSPDALARQAHILLTDIYTILVQECTRVLNSIFSSTVVKFEELEFDSPSEMGGLAALDDEVERDRQRFNRLQALATDCSADSRRAAAEQVHLERVQLANRGQGMSSDPSMVHSAYTEYAMYMLGMRKFVSQNNSFLLERAKEVLELAFMATSSVLSSTQLLVSICVELGDLNRAETLLCNVLQGQLSNKGLDNLSNLDGYETDEIVSSVDYLSYIILAVLRLRQGSPIAARRAIRLAVRALEHEIDRGEYSIDLGRPKRGAVVCLGRAALYFFERGMPSIAQTCYSLASDSDSATSKKAMARSMPADTPPVIRYILKSAESFAHLHAGRVDEAIFASEESANVTNDRQLEAKGKSLVV